MQHSRDYLNADVKSLKLMMQHRAGKHKIEGSVTYKIENIKENSAEYEYRDSAGYNVPHTGRDLKMIYSLRARNELKAFRLEFVTSTKRVNHLQVTPCMRYVITR